MRRKASAHNGAAARLAGLPDEVVGRAKEILAGLEQGEGETSGQKIESQEVEPVISAEPESKPIVEPEDEKIPPKPSKRRSRDQSDPSQLELF
mgnify:CR=1 FL=1